MPAFRTVLHTLLGLLLTTAAASAQNPIQWQGNARSAVEHAREQMLPLMVWVYDSTDDGLGGRGSDIDDLRDAQEDAFRDPAVVSLAHNRYVPLRLMRNSQNKAVLEELGLPTEYGLYVALVTTDKRLLDRIGIEDVADARALASRLAESSQKYTADLYQRDLRSVITDPSAKKPDVRKAVRAVWRLKILSADTDIVALLKRPDITPTERGRLYSLLADLGTPSCVSALLDAAAEDKSAVSALNRAHAGALETLQRELPVCGQPATERQLTAYRAVVTIAKAGAVRPATFWTDTPQEKCEAELTRLKERAEAVLAYSRSRESGVE
jgi:hypothetical protein